MWENRNKRARDEIFHHGLSCQINDYHKLVLNVPTGEFNANPLTKDLIGYERIVATLPHIISNRYEGALLPIELAHGIVSLSTYPSARILRLFSESAIEGK